MPSTNQRISLRAPTRTALLVVASVVSAQSSLAQRATVADVIAACHHPFASSTLSQAYQDLLRDLAKLKVDAQRVESAAPGRAFADKSLSKTPELAGQLSFLCERLVLPPATSLRALKVNSDWSTAMPGGAIPSGSGVANAAASASEDLKRYARQVSALTALATVAYSFDLDSGAARAAAIDGLAARFQRTPLVVQVLFPNRTNTTGAEGEALRKQWTKEMQAVLNIKGVIDWKAGADSVVMLARSESAPPGAVVMVDIDQIKARVVAEERLDATRSAANSNDAQTVTGERSAMTAASWAVALSDVVMEKAQDQVNTVFVDLAAARVCRFGVVNGKIQSVTGDDFSKRDHVGITPLFEAACGLVSSSEGRLPSLDALRAALRSDVTSVLPQLLVAQIRAARDSEHARGRRVQLDVALAMVVFSREYVAQADAHVDREHAVRVALERTFNEVSNDASQLAYLLEFVAALEDEARIDASLFPVNTRADSLLLYALRTAYVNTTNGATTGTFARLASTWAELQAVMKTDERLKGDTLTSQAMRVATRFRGYTRLAKAALGVADKVEAPLVDSLAAATEELVVQLVGRNYLAAVNALVRATRTTWSAAERRDALGKDGARLLALSADLATAQDVVQVRVSLRRFIDEGDGFLAKREGDPDGPRFKLNAYAGGAAAFGIEQRIGDQQYALALPVGLEVGWRQPRLRLPLMSRWRPYWSERLPLPVPYVGLLLAPVDLGAVASLRQRGGAADSAAAEVSQAVSPALYAVIGLPPLRIPWTLLIGRQWLRTTTIGHARERWVFAIAVDVPLFP